MDLNKKPIFLAADFVTEEMCSFQDRSDATNDEVLRRLKKNTELINTIKIRKLSYFGHIIRNPKYQFLQLVIQGKIAGHRGPGRRRTSWLKNLRAWFGKTSLELFRAAVNKAMIVNMIANIR